MPIKTFIPRSNEWLEARQSYVTGTEVAALLGLDKYKSWKKIKANKLEYSSVMDNDYMRAGRILEPGVLIALNEAGIDARPAHDTQTVFAYDENYRLSASLDGKGRCPNNGFYIVECKTTQPTKFDAWYEGVPLNYFLQVQVQLLLSDVDIAVLACMSTNFPFPLVAWEVVKDETTCNYLIDASKRFWTAVESGEDFIVDKVAKEYVKETYLTFCKKIID
jgi:putative phage-type endonuclease